MSNDSNQTTAEPENPWKETVRDIFDKIMFAQGTEKLVEEILTLIETNHHDYFCEANEISNEGSTS